ncbi:MULTISPECIES: hypothetical protein [unclassified Xanthomonas]|uniref:hypothetical protein n=1 Tax=unclassified Xanthomonas TaxID=2643310 RepID=UPI0013707BD2|nr:MULTISPECIES: hypothetical protein [unclassified Xanthomonas]MBB5943505.1 hypothetical protein [Xanthomonas sp. 3307]
MKKVFANLVIALGALVALTGLLGTPLVLHQLPISLMLSSDGQTSHRYFRAVPAELPWPGYLPYLFLLVGGTMFIAGVLWLKKIRGTAA